MVTIDDVNKILSKSKEQGFDVRMADIAYVVLSSFFDEKSIAYAILYGKNFGKTEVNEYDKSAKIKFLKKNLKDYIEKAEITKSISKPSHKDISFEENKDALIELLNTIRDMKSKGEIEAKDAVKLETDIRIKLNDKFDVSSDKHEKRVVVNAKYNHICEWTKKECFLQTKDYAIKNWGLVDLDELRKEYDLVPKTTK